MTAQQPAAGHDDIRLLHRYFGGWLVRQFAGDMPEALQEKLDYLARAASLAVELKHTCLQLDKVAHLQEPQLQALLAPVSDSDLAALAAYHLPPMVISPQERCVWLQKYHWFESRCAAMLKQRATHPAEALSPAALAWLDRLFAEGEQKQAAEKALVKRLAVITGGPGTGKTYTVARIIALLLQQDENSRIMLAAPTGKAGQRMKEALDTALNEDSFAGIRHLLERLPEKASTLHKLLGIGRQSPRPRHHKNNPLSLDVLIVDEASMVDLPMMYRLLDALDDNARLILLGDKDQLASVEAGSVLAELCQSETLADSIANITVSRRFSSQPEIGALANWLNNPGLMEKPDITAGNNVCLHLMYPGNEWQPRWLATAVEHYRARSRLIKAGADVVAILKEQTAFQLLCALRRGPFGVNGINRMICEAMDKPHDSWYAGRPVMVLENAGERQLYNGDVGLVLPLDADEKTIDPDGVLKACFLTTDGFRAVSRAQMPAYETCYAMTVHKSQGSEYRHVMIVLPADAESVADNPVLSRELAYTAVTRASGRIDIYAGNNVLEAMARRKTVRMSALANSLAKADNFS